MILTKSKVHIKPENPKIRRMFGGMVDQVVGEVVEIMIPSPQALDQRTLYWVRIGMEGDKYVSCLENELEIIA